MVSPFLRVPAPVITSLMPGQTNLVLLVLLGAACVTALSVVWLGWTTAKCRRIRRSLKRQAGKTWHRISSGIGNRVSDSGSFQKQTHPERISHKKEMRRNLADIGSAAAAREVQNGLFLQDDVYRLKRLHLRPKTKPKLLASGFPTTVSFSSFGPGFSSSPPSNNPYNTPYITSDLEFAPQEAVVGKPKLNLIKLHQEVERPAWNPGSDIEAQLWRNTVGPNPCAFQSDQELQRQMTLDRLSRRSLYLSGDGARSLQTDMPTVFGVRGEWQGDATRASGSSPAAMPDLRSKVYTPYNPLSYRSTATGQSSFRWPLIAKTGETKAVRTGDEARPRDEGEETRERRRTDEAGRGRTHGQEDENAAVGAALSSRMLVKAAEASSGSLIFKAK